MQKSSLLVGGHILVVDDIPKVKFSLHDHVVIKNEGGVAVRQSGSMSISSLQGGTIFFHLAPESLIIDVMNKLMRRQMGSACLFNICIMFDGKEVVNLKSCAFGLQPSIGNHHIFSIEFLKNMEFHETSEFMSI